LQHGQPLLPTWEQWLGPCCPLPDTQRRKMVSEQTYLVKMETVGINDPIGVPVWVVPVDGPAYLFVNPLDANEDDARYHFGVLMDMGWLVEIGGDDE